MAAKLIVALEAQLDVEAAYAWYEGRRVGLGEEFLGAVDACIQGICRSPDMYTPIYRTYRRGLVRRFPYAVYYEHAHGTVTIYGVFHTARDQRKWRARLG